VASLALVEPGWRDEWGTVAMQAHAEGDTARLSGIKLFVPFAPHADLLLVAARNGDAGTCLVAVEAGTHGVECTGLRTLGGDHQYAVRFAGAQVPRANMIGTAAAATAAIDAARARAAVASMAYMVGAAERVLEMTVDYAKTRVQFGQPIGSFQAVAHRCVDMRSDVDALRYLVYQAAWTLAAGRPGALEVSAAQAYGSEALRRIFMHAHQVHGAIGFSSEHDLQLFTRRAKAAELQWGSPSLHFEHVASAMGL
jgi:alkylation response protein AidB-like acyl-CoA dehydrogenase